MSESSEPELVILRYPGSQAGHWRYVALKPSGKDSEVYELAGSWQDTAEQVREECGRGREWRERQVTVRDKE